MKTLVVYYSKSGNNKFLAGKIAEKLGSDIEQIVPRLNAFAIQVLFSLIGKGMGIKAPAHSISEYEKIVICVPIWMGKLIYPAYAFITRFLNSIRKLYFVTCCGGDESEKDSRFGYNAVFNRVRNIAGDKCTLCEAFPITLALPEEKRKDSEAVMKAHLSDNNFTGDFLNRFNVFTDKVIEN
ncbi:MAG: flavodoxin family protein [Fibrobacter sp.]|nr:flavodoxin family protein [Fibrobacter sp.]